MLSSRPSHRPLNVLAWLALTLAVAWLPGCGEKDKAKIPVAKIQDKVVTLDYFERKLNSIDPHFLPADINTHAGRLRFLDTIVEKEVLAIKAQEMGFGTNPKLQETVKALTDLNSVTLMKNEVVKPAMEVSEKEILDYYENLGRNLRISYMLFDKEPVALQARGLVEGGEDWASVAKRLSVGTANPSDNYTQTAKYGTMADDLEKAMWDLEVGEISRPIRTMYGYFLIRVEGQVMERVPPLDTMRDKVIQSIQKSKGELLTLDFIQKVFDEYSFSIDEAVLDTLFSLLPPDEEMLPPKKAEELQPLYVPPDLLGKVLMKYADQVWTLERYQSLYNNMSSLARPRREQRVGKLRRELEEIAVRELMPLAARKRGYVERPEVQDELKSRSEQIMVTQLHDELIKGEVKVTAADVDTFWAAHASEFFEPESREVVGLVCKTEDEARAATTAARQGMEWSQVVAQFCEPGPLKDGNGQMKSFSKNDRGVFPELAFSVPGVGGVSDPAPTADKKWAVVKVTNVFPEHQPALDEIREKVGRVVESRMADALFKKRLGEWRAGMNIKLYEKNVDKAVLTRTDLSPAGSGTPPVASSGPQPSRGAGSTAP